jgi:tetratricopeptide (TPR) repeat protein
MPALATIARRLDGIPLALELAAGRVAELGVAAVVDGLTDRFSLLTNGFRTALPRHRTLEATVAWTVDLLAPEEREALVRLSLLLGRWPDAAVAEVCDLGPGGQATLARLVERALLVREGRPARLRMLDTIRAFASRLADAGTIRRVEARRDDALRERLGRVSQLPEDDMLEEIGALLPDALASTEPGRTIAAIDRAALQGALVPWFEFQGLWQEGSRRLSEVVADCPPSAVRAGCVASLANLEALLGHQAEATERAREVLADRYAADPARAMALMVAFPPGVSGGEGGGDPLDDAIELARSNPGLQMAARTRRAARRMAVGQLAEAEVELGQVAADAERAGRWVIASQANVNRGNALIFLGRLEEADEALRRGEEVALGRNVPAVLGIALFSRALLASRQGRVDEAMTLATRRVEIARQMADERGEAPALSLIFNVALARGDLAQARDVGARCVELSERLQQPEASAVAAFNLAMLSHRTGDLEGAASWAHRVAAIASRSSAPPLVQLALVVCGAVACYAGDADGHVLLAAADAHDVAVPFLEEADRTWIARAGDELRSSGAADAGAEQEARGRALDPAGALSLSLEVTARVS